MIPLGPSVLYWCNDCNLAVLKSKECPVCGGRTADLDYHFDVRPAFDYDRDLMRRTVNGQFGEGAFECIVPDDRLILFGIEFRNDIAYRVFCDGSILGDLTAFNGRWSFAPSSRAASLIKECVTRHLVEATSRGQSMSIRMHKLPGDEVKEADPAISRGDTVFIKNGSGTIKSFGSAVADSGDLQSVKIAVRGTLALKKKPSLADKYHTWGETVRLNWALIEGAVKSSTNFIRTVVKKHEGIPYTVSLSGGKDSLATLLLVLKAGYRPKVIYVDTHMDCGSSSLVKSIADRYGLEMVSCGIPEDILYRNIERLGPPSADYRWCCRIHQLTQFQILTKKLGSKSLSFIGQRRYEGTKRMRVGDEWVNPAAPDQHCASPIQEWNALHVWMFLTTEDAPYNKLYEQGFDRIGCYVCPVAPFTLLAKKNWDDPVAERWWECIEKYGRDRGMPQEWHDKMLWRYRTCHEDAPDVPSEIMRDIEERQRIVTYRTVVTDGVAYSGRRFDPAEVLPLLPIIGRQGHMENGCLLTDDLKVSTDSRIAPIDGDVRGLKEDATDIFDISLMATFCLECSLCVYQCDSSAIEFDGGRIKLDASKCNGCRNCIKTCPSIQILSPRVQ